ncbi:uncharacterized protein STEHIDRAFT_151293 [Stereum hirsutum FP-91666 SS1]|uniref:uncharacterized protein n=1 Tax=Stereum hirsutum (strain FP-91666) TaxID=721885 RepID=UPI000440FEA6|nr:uncharacterized protein STEHIDRAFT_151293 [Stereum hirsutum FP-91666 SS1]EIM91938.1 hypothetical protein STEHIDRAFT_151293 [Stereum hirsutum FP-91666 SS1]
MPFPGTEQGMDLYRVESLVSRCPKLSFIHIRHRPSPTPNMLQLPEHARLEENGISFS